MPVKNIWWANHGQRFHENKSYGCMWAPLENDTGEKLFHWENVGKVAKGDIILHCVHGKITHVSRAISGAQRALEPHIHFNARMGYLVSCEYHELNVSINIKNIGKKLYYPGRKYWPINKNGDPNQGFLYKFAQDGLNTLIKAYPAIFWPQDFKKLWGWGQ